LDAALKNAFAPRHHVVIDAVPDYAGLSPETAGFDIDGVIADTMRLFVDIARDAFQIDHIRYEDITSYNLEECLDLDPTIIDAIIAQIIDGTHAPQLHAIAGCCDTMARFGAGGQPVRFVTARPEAGVIRTWLQSTLPLAAGQIEVVATGSFEAKATVLHAEGIQVFVEDRLETCFLLSRAGITPILYAQPWNRSPHPFREVSSWEEIASLLAG
jgi:uncharacterized HAD superfamily protein